MARLWLHGLKRWFKPRGTQDHGAPKAPTVSPKANEAQPAGSLYYLPEDILFMISRYLRPGEVLTLMLCCARFWGTRWGAGVFAKLWKRMASPSNKSLGNMGARFYVLRMLEYDGLLQKYCCWGCMKAHKQRAFLPGEFEKSVNLKGREEFLPEEASRRSCVLATRYILVLVGCEMSLAEFRHAITYPLRKEFKYPPRKRLSDPSLFDENNAAILSRDGFVFSRGASMFDYCMTFEDKIHSIDSFRRLVCETDHPLCPHIQLCDAKIVRLYNQPLRWLSCKHCTTAVQVHVKRARVYIRVVRHIGWLRSPTDPWWMAQSYVKRHQRLKAKCHKSCRWYQRLYSVEEYAGDPLVGISRLRRPFKGTASCKLKGPEIYQRLVKSS